MSGAVSLQRSEDELIYIDTLKVPQEGTQGVPRVVSGINVDTLPICRAGCGKPVLARATWRALPESDRLKLRRLQIRRDEARGVCGGCYPKARTSGLLQELAATEPAKNAPKYVHFDIPALWKEIRRQNGGYPELANTIGSSQEYARQLVCKLGLPRMPRKSRLDVEERTLFIEELERLISFGQGVHRISRAFSLTEEELIDKVGKLRERGYTNVRFDTYMEMAA